MDEDIRKVFSKGKVLPDDLAAVVNTICQMIKDCPQFGWVQSEEGKVWWSKIEEVLGLSRHVYDIVEDGCDGCYELYQYFYEKIGTINRLLHFLPSCSTDDFMFLLLPNEYVILFNGFEGTLLFYEVEEAYHDYKLYRLSSN
jgi:hypothetical protein